MLGSPTEAQRDRDLAALLRFGLASYRPSRVVDVNRTYALVPSAGDARPSRSWRRAPSSVLPRPGARSSSASSPRVVATLPVRAGQRLGTVVVTDGSRVVARSPLVASRAEPEPTLAQKARWVAGRSFDRLVGLVS